MVRRPRKPRRSFGRARSIFGSQKEEEQPAPRRLDLENALCAAIQNRYLVTLRYDDDFTDRLTAAMGGPVYGTSEMFAVMCLAFAGKSLWNLWRNR